MCTTTIVEIICWISIEKFYIVMRKKYICICVCGAHLSTVDLWFYSTVLKIHQDFLSSAHCIILSHLIHLYLYSWILVTLKIFSLYSIAYLPSLLHFLLNCNFSFQGCFGENDKMHTSSFQYHSDHNYDLPSKTWCYRNFICEPKSISIIIKIIRDKARYNWLTFGTWFILLWISTTVRN